MINFLKLWVPSILKYWWVFLLSFIVIASVLAYRHQCNRADTAEAALEVYRIAEIKQLAENAVKHTIAVSNDGVADVLAKADTARLQLDRTRETKNLKDLYEDRLNSTISDFNYRLRIAADSANNLSESNGDPVRLTESERECHSAFTTLEAACQLTTIDFNRCRAWADNVCLTVGCL